MLARIMDRNGGGEGEGIVGGGGQRNDMKCREHLSCNGGQFGFAKRGGRNGSKIEQLPLVNSYCRLAAQWSRSLESKRGKLATRGGGMNEHIPWVCGEAG